MIKNSSRQTTKSRNSRPSEPWYQIKNSASGNPEVYIYDEIDPFWGISAESFSAEIRDITALEIDVHINSPGGSMYDGIAIYNILRSHPAKVNVFIDSVAASIASLIALAGDRVEIAETGTFMIHDPYTVVGGDAEALRHAADVMDKFKEIAVSVYRDKTGKPADELSELMSAETWLNANEALEMGFVDGIFNGLEIENKFALEAVYNAVPESIRGGTQPIKGPILCTPGMAGKNQTKKESIMHTCTKCGKKHESADLALSCCAESVSPENRTEPPAPVMRAQTPVAPPPPPATPPAPMPVEDLTGRHAEISNLSELHNMPKGWAARMIAEKASPETVRDEIINHLANAQPASTGPATVVRDSRDKMQMALTDGLKMRVKVRIDNPAPGAADFRGMSLMRIADMVCRENGIDTHRMTDENIARAALGMYVQGMPISNSAGLQPSDLPIAFQNTVDQVLKEAYYGAPGTFRAWTQTEQFTDFRVKNWGEIEGIPSLDKIPPGGEYKEFRLSERSGGWRIYKYGKRITFSWEMIVNDEYSILTTIPRKFGFASDRLVNGLAYGQLTGNAKTPDGVVTFHSTHKNIGTPGPPDRAALLEGARLLAWQPADQTVDGKKAEVNVMGLSPSFVLAGYNNQEILMENLTNETAVTDSAGAKNTNSDLKNPVRDLATPIIDPILDGVDKTSTAWYMGADPMYTGGVTIGWLNGEENPTVIRTENQNVDGVTVKCRICVGKTTMDHRPLVYNAGA